MSDNEHYAAPTGADLANDEVLIHLCGSTLLAIIRDLLESVEAEWDNSEGAPDVLVREMLREMLRRIETFYRKYYS